MRTGTWGAAERAVSCMATFTTTTRTPSTSLSGATATILTHPPSSPSVSAPSTKAVTIITENAFSIEWRPGDGSPMGLHGPLSTGQWALYSWAEVSAWLARHYPATAAAATSHDREIAAADHLIRGRHILPPREDRADLAQLLTG